MRVTVKHETRTEHETEIGGAAGGGGSAGVLQSATIKLQAISFNQAGMIKKPRSNAHIAITVKHKTQNRGMVGGGCNQYAASSIQVLEATCNQLHSEF